MVWDKSLGVCYFFSSPWTIFTKMLLFYLRLHSSSRIYYLALQQGKSCQSFSKQLIQTSLSDPAQRGLLEKQQPGEGYMKQYDSNKLFTVVFFHRRANQEEVGIVLWSKRYHNLQSCRFCTHSIYPMYSHVLGRKRGGTNFGFHKSLK